MYSRSLIKICGLSRLQDIEAANAALPDYIGFVFAPSKRQVTAALAATLKAALNPRIPAVGVFVDAPQQEILELAVAGTIDIVQLHGKENARYIAALRDVLPNTPIIKSVTFEQLVAFSQTGHEDAARHSLPDYLLIDNATAGSGVELAELRAHTDALKTAIASSPLPVFLAGGINLNNIAMALELEPFAIDISSGAETNDGKDAAKISKLVSISKASVRILRKDCNYVH
jgi:phosphoribosylanthranilate isomerase